MQILNQPFDGQLGNYLKENLNKDYDCFTFFSAFAKNSGVLRLKPYIEKFKQRGGYVEGFIGVDSGGTSYEAVLNLLDLCNNLYIIHSEQQNTTYHSKIYLFSSKKNNWLTIGSNNFTGGGLWTNFETSICLEYDNSDIDKFLNIYKLIETYKNTEYKCSKLLSSKEDIDLLLKYKYLYPEVQLKIASKSKKTYEQDSELQKIFGTQKGIAIPSLTNHKKTAKESITTKHPISASDTSEYMWVESKALTGGSRNILDLSKRGRIIESSREGYPYIVTDPNFIRGSITFFDIEPDSTDCEKIVTINYEGIDYNNCVIKFPVGDKSNKSWRIQLKGISSSGTTLHRVNGPDWLCNKILVFEKIQTDYYSLSVLSEKELEHIMSNSKVVATNGNAKASKKFGFM